MAIPKPICAPSNAPVHDSVRVPASATSLVRSLIRLTIPSLIDLALQWLQDENQASCAPYLANNRNLEEEVDEDYLWSPAESIEELRLIYNRLRFETTVNRRYVVDRMLDGDWRRGLSLFQVATIDFQFLSDSDKALRWTALKMVPQNSEEDSEDEPLKKKRKTGPAPYSTVSPKTFLQNLQHEISPIVKAHYHLRRVQTLQNLSVIRVCVADSPYAIPQSSAQSSLLFTDPTRVIFIAVPDSCPYIYVSVSGTARGASLLKRKPSLTRMDMTSLKRIVLEGIPKALSRSQHRYSLQSTALTARSLLTILALRGNCGTNAANGAYNVFAKGVVDNSPIDAEKITFAQKILDACEDSGDSERDHSNAELSSGSLQPSDRRTVLTVRSTNALMARTAQDELVDLKIAGIKRFGLPDSGEQKPELAESKDAKVPGGLDRLQVRFDEELFLQDDHKSPSKPPQLGNHDVDPFDQITKGDLPRQDTARMTLTFQGSDVFQGLRKLVESSAISLQKMPAWMTGEEAISGGTVKGGILVRGRGGGA